MHYKRFTRYGDDFTYEKPKPHVANAQPAKLPMAPMRPYLERLIATNSHQKLNSDYGTRPYQLKKMCAREKIRWDVADRWCVKLGLHPAMLWPDEWVEFR